MIALGWIRKKGFLEIGLALWILWSMYLWILSSPDISTHLIKKLPRGIYALVEENRKEIWPYIWRKYIFADPDYTRTDE